jgi:hypothetical protein
MLVDYVSNYFGYTATQCTPELHTTIFHLDYVLTFHVILQLCLCM